MATADTNKPPEVIVVEDKPERISLAELKNGKLAVKQKGLSFEKMSETMQEIVQFRGMLEGRVEAKEPPLTAIPDEHRPLIAKLSHESDKTLASLAKHIQHELLPAQDEDDEQSSKAILASLPLDVVEKAIKSVATRINYGLDVSILPNAPVSAKVPAGWQIWRWEVKEEFRDWLPKNAKDKAIARIAERQQIKEDVLALFQGLPESDRASIISGGKAGARAAPNKSANKSDANDTSKTISNGSQDTISPAKDTKTVEDHENGQPPPLGDDPDTLKTQKGRPKKPVDPEKAAKEKERLEKKQAKEEREKKAKEAADKSRNLMASFFGKPKLSHASSSKSIETTKAEPKPKETTSSGGPSDFEKAFKGFLLKRDATIAPTNWFKEVQRGKVPMGKGKERDVIVIDDDEPMVVEKVSEDVRMDVDEDVSITHDPHLGQLTPEERLKNSISSLHPHLRPPIYPFPTRRHPTLKSYHPYVVRNIMQQLTEAEVNGDDTLVRSLLTILRDRHKIPAKVLIFHEDSRPGYFGTWTRNSREVGPRSPFARDVVSIDYTVDSEAEWEEEEEGDVLEGEEEDAEDDAGPAEEVDSDLDSWLVDDDEVEDPGTPIEEREGSPEFPFPPPPKRKAKSEGEKEAKKRKVVVPLVPFTKGPCWENTIGEPPYEPFKAYTIQLLNDTPFPIDPFRFTSTPVDEKVLRPPQANGLSKHSTQGNFAVPALPAHLSASSSNTALASPTPAITSSPSNSTTGATSAKRTAPPKTTFPETHMPLLLAKIKELDTGNLTFIVETVYKELSTQKAGVKKNAIEAKVREIGEKSKDGGSAKVWVVKPDVRALYGVA